MAMIPPNPWIPAANFSGGGRGVGPCHVIIVASALRLGRLLRGHLLLCSHSPEGYYSDNLNSAKDIWCQRLKFIRRYSLLETLAHTFSSSCSSCFSFVNGKESGRGNLDRSSLQYKTSDGNFFNGRLWTNVILALNVLVYAAQIATQGKLMLWGAKINGLIDKGQLWRLATSSFLHANIGHLMVNCYSLNAIGPTVEQLSGPTRFLAAYFTSAIASSMMSYRFCQAPAVGASGAIFGLVGSFGIFAVRHRKLFGGGKQNLEQIVRVIALNMVIGLLVSGIDNWGHVGGLLGGAAISWLIGPAWKYEGQSDDGRLVFADKAPIFRLIKRSR